MTPNRNQSAPAPTSTASRAIPGTASGVRNTSGRTSRPSGRWDVRIAATFEARLASLNDAVAAFEVSDAAFRCLLEPSPESLATSSEAFQAAMTSYPVETIASITESPYLAAAQDKLLAAARATDSALLTAATRVHEGLSGYADGISMLGTSAYSELMRETQEQLERWRSDEDTRAAFNAARFVPSPYLDSGFKHRLVAAHQEGKPHQELEAMIAEHYDANRCGEVVEIVRRLCRNKRFDGRQATLRQTLRAHKAKKAYNSITVYPLAAMIEGIVMPFLAATWHLWEPDEGGPKKRKTPRQGDMPAVLDGACNIVRYSRGLVGATCLVEYMEGPFLEGFDIASPPPTDDDLRRNPLMHGHALGGTRLQTLRAFVMLDFLGFLMPYLWAEFRERYPEAFAEQNVIG